MPMPRNRCLSRTTARAKRLRARRLAETPEQRAKRLEDNRSRNSLRRSLESTEQRTLRLKNDRIRRRDARSTQKNKERLKRLYEVLSRVGQASKDNEQHEVMPDDDTTETFVENIEIEVDIDSIPIDTPQEGTPVSDCGEEQQVGLSIDESTS